MSNILFLLRRDIKKILTNWVALMVVMGICLLPSLYAWFNISANMDPYNNTKGIKIAVVNNDQGVDRKETGNVDIGKEIIKKVKKNEKIGWQFVDTEQAQEGVRSGEYYAAIIIPESFSKDMLSFLDGKTDQPRLDYYVNEKKNAVAPKVTDTGASTIQMQVNETFKKAVSRAIIKALKTNSAKIKSDLNSTGDKLVEKLQTTRNILGQYNAAIESFNGTHSKAQKLDKSTRKLIKSTDKTLEALQESIGANAQLVTDTDENVKALMADIELHRDELGSVADTMLEQLSEFDGQLQDIDKAMVLSDALVTVIRPTGSQLAGMMTNLNKGLNDINDAVNGMSEAIGQADELLEGAQTDINSIKSSENFKVLNKISNINKDNAAAFIASPIELTTEKLYPVKNYGSGMAPFFTMLAIWVGGLILVAIFKMEVDVKEAGRRITMKQSYFARSLLFTGLGLIQAFITCVGDIYILGIQCLNPGTFILAGLVASVAFVNLIYALAVVFRHIGKALAVLLVILQIPGSSGTYPIELTGKFFQMLHPLLPFTYGVNAMRESIAGYYGNYYVQDLAVLLLFLGIALVIGLGLRPQLSGINNTMDKRLRDTDLMTGAEKAMTIERYRLNAVTDIIASGEEGRKLVLAKADAFAKRHEAFEKHGVKFVFLVPFVFLILMFVTDAKMLMLCLWIGSVIVTAAFLMLFEHAYQLVIKKREEVAENEENIGDI